MLTATIESVTEKSHPQYGPEKISKITLSDGESKTAYTKPAAQSIYESLRAGLQVEIEAKSNGKGYIIKNIIGEAPAGLAPEKNGQAQEKGSGKKNKWTAEVKGKFIAEKAGHYAMAYEYVSNQFDAKGLLVTEETLRAAAATVLISMDKHMLKY